MSPKTKEDKKKRMIGNGAFRVKVVSSETLNSILHL